MALLIAICHDEKRINAELESMLLDILGRLHVKCETDVYFTGEELCNQMENGTHYNLIFLDIDMA